MAKQLGNMYIKFDTHVMFTSGEKKIFPELLTLGSYVAKHYSQNEVFAAKCWSELKRIRRRTVYLKCRAKMKPLVELLQLGSEFLQFKLSKINP